MLYFSYEKIEIKRYRESIPEERLYQKTPSPSRLTREWEKFNIQVLGEKINIPKNAVINIEHERSKKSEELEFQIRWKN